MMESASGKQLIAVAGEDTFGKSFISVVNKEIAPMGLMAIGINITPEAFDNFISHLPKSKVEATIFMPEFQKKAAAAYGREGYLLALINRGGDVELLCEDEQRAIDDRELYKIITTLRERYGI